MWYITTALRLWVALACVTWGGVQSLLNLGFDNRLPWGPLLIGALLCFVVMPDGGTLEQFKAHAQRKRQLAEDAQRRALAAMAQR
jgi:hypothetical protein